MNIYFSCSITGGRRDQAIYQHIVDHLTALGHEVPTAHLSRADILDEEQVIDPQHCLQPRCEMGGGMRRAGGRGQHTLAWRGL